MDSQQPEHQEHHDDSQSTQSATTISTQTSYHGNHNCPWGRLTLRKWEKRSLGMGRRPKFELDKSSDPQHFAMIGPTFGVGRANSNQLCLTSEIIGNVDLDHFSAFHFRLSKDLSNDKNPVFIEDLSRFGTFIQDELIGPKKKQIVQSDDVISIGKNLKIIFTFQSHHVFVHDLPKSILDRYHIGPQLGEGGFGIVYDVYETHTCKRYALKFVKNVKSSNSDPVEKAANEANILRSLNHPCIIQIHGVVSSTADSIGILLEFMAGGDLRTRINNDGYLKEANAKHFFYQICVGLKYLHSNRVTHRDIKPENILLATNEMNTLIKITDFGLSKMIHNNSVMRTVCGTKVFAAPEVVRANGIKDTYTNKVDIWSLGILLLFALTGTFPESKVVHAAYDPANPVTHAAKSVIKRMLTVDSRLRPSIGALLSDPWLNDAKIIQAADALMKQWTTTNESRKESSSPMIIELDD